MVTVTKVHKLGTEETTVVYSLIINVYHINPKHLLYLITCLIFAGKALLVFIKGNARKNTKTPTNIFTVTLIWENVPTQSLAIQTYLDRPYAVPSKNNSESCN